MEVTLNFLCWQECFFRKMSADEITLSSSLSIREIQKSTVSCMSFTKFLPIYTTLWKIQCRGNRTVKYHTEETNVIFKRTQNYLLFLRSYLWGFSKYLSYIIISTEKLHGSDTFADYCLENYWKPEIIEGYLLTTIISGRNSSNAFRNNNMKVYVDV